MHELSIMESAMNLALGQAREAGAARIHLIRLRVGALSGVVPEALAFAFEALASGTIAEKAELHLDPVPARFWCNPCQNLFPAEDLLAACPRCGTVSHELRTGRELELASLEIE